MKDNDSVETVFPLPVWVVVLAFVVCLPSILAGCAKPEVPLCQKYKGQLIYSPSGEPHVAIDMENVKILAEVLKGLQEGTCRIEFPAPEGKEV